MNIGYACLNIGIKNSSYKTFRKANFTEKIYLETIGNNLEVLKDTIKYNIKNNINLFRISSDIIPFGSHEEIKINWENRFEDEILEIKQLIVENNLRISMHPGQYTVINSKDESVVEKSIRDLEYHNKVLDLLTVDKMGKIIIHIGGVYGDKNESKKRFIHNFKKIPADVRKRVVIENDDKLYNIEDVIEISDGIKAPVVFDNLHNQVNPSNLDLSEKELIKLCNRTWREDDGAQKIHYSQQDTKKRPGGHSRTIDLDIFSSFLRDIDLQNNDIDIMLEVKDKNLSAIKCNNLIRKDRKIKYLEKEWSKYKYNILEHNHKLYLEIRELLKDKTSYPVEEFYRLIDTALNEEVNFKSFENGANHVWGYFKELATDKEKNKYFMYLDKVKLGKYKQETLKKYLLSLSFKYNVDYISSSLYADLS